MNIEEQYLDLLEDVLQNGVGKSDRTGTGTLSVFGRQIRHSMSEGFPLLTTKRMSIKTVATELLWFLRGDTNIKYLLDNGCNIWNGDAYKSYFNRFEPSTWQFTPDTFGEFITKIKTDDEFAENWGELGPIYGIQWRDWKTFFTQKQGVDQIQNIINGLKNNPDSRRLMVSAWNVGELDEMTLPPCHYGFQFYTRELSQSERFNYYRKLIGSDMHHDHIIEEMNENNVPTRAISLMWNQRSADLFLGLPFNIASYATLLSIFAEEVNMIPDELIGNLGDVHLYKNHVEQATLQLSRDPYDLPLLSINKKEGSIIERILEYEPSDFSVIKYNCYNSIKAPLSN